MVETGTASQAEENAVQQVTYVRLGDSQSYTAASASTESRSGERPSGEFRIAFMSKRVIEGHTYLVATINVAADAVRRTIRELNRKLREE
jgi:hypothetical protein